MRVFGYELTLTKALPLPPRSPSGGGWWPIVREPYTGAWQKNDEQLNPATVLSNPTVFRCYSLITTDIGKTPLRLVEHDRNGIWTETSNPAFSPVLRRPNPYQNPQQFYEAWVGSKLLYGNAYILKERDDRGVVRARYVLDPAKVKPLIAPDGAVYYELQANELAGVVNEPRPIVPASEMIHDRWNCLFHPLVGVSPLYAVGGAAIQAGKIQDNSTAFFANNSQPSGIVLVPGAPTDEQMQRMMTAWKAARGDLNRGGTAFLTEGQKYESVTQSATDSQLTEQSRQIANTIAGAWGVPISMVDSSQQPPYANSEATQLQYRSQCLQTHMTAIENCLDEDVPDPYGHEFDIDVLIWMDTTTKTQAARDAIGSGAMAPNEARSKYFGLPPVPGGDTPYLQQQYQSLEAAAMRDSQPPEPAPQPAPLIEVPELMALVTLAQVKAHLRLTTAAGDPGDADLNQKMAAGEAAILNYVNRSEQGRTNSAAWVDPTTVPLDVQHAMLLKVGELDRFRGDDLADDGPDLDPDSGLSRAITSLLRRWSDPVIGMIATGLRRQYVTLEAAAPAVGDGDGGYTETYAPLVPPDAYAAIEAAPGSQEQRIAGTAIASAAYRVTMPYRSDVTTKARIAFVDRGGRSHLLWVRGVENPDQAGVVLELWCEEHVPEAP